MRKSTARRIKAERQAYLHRIEQERKQRDESAELRSLIRSAVHEAAHAVAHELLLGGNEYVHIERTTEKRGDMLLISSGYTQPRIETRPRLTRESLGSELVSCLSGPLIQLTQTCRVGFSGPRLPPWFPVLLSDQVFQFSFS